VAFVSTTVSASTARSVAGAASASMAASAAAARSAVGPTSVSMAGSASLARSVAGQASVSTVASDATAGTASACAHMARCRCGAAIVAQRALPPLRRPRLAPLTVPPPRPLLPPAAQRQRRLPHRLPALPRPRRASASSRATAARVTLCVTSTPPCVCSDGSDSCSLYSSYYRYYDGFNSSKSRSSSSGRAINLQVELHWITNTLLPCTFIFHARLHSYF